MRLSVIGISSWGVTWKRLVEAEEVAWVVLGLDAQQPTVVRAVVGVPQSCRSGSGKFGYTTPDPDGCTSAHDTPASRGQRFRPGRRRDQCRPGAGGGAESGEVVFLCIGRARRELPLLPPTVRVVTAADQGCASWPPLCRTLWWRAATRAGLAGGSSGAYRLHAAADPLSAGGHRPP